MLTTDYVPGAPSWIDLDSPDPAASVRFYGRLFGWTYESAGPDSGGYGFFRLDGRLAAGVGPLMSATDRPAWNVYFSTADADATVAAALEAGGSVRLPPTDVSGAGRLAVLADPTGAAFSLWQPGGTLGLDVVNEPGALIWTELYTTDATAAGDFYRRLFSWSLEEAPMPDVSYTLVSPFGHGGGKESAHGGILQLAAENLAAGSGPEWHPYFATVDVDRTVDTALRQGATVLIPPLELPGVGRMAMFADPAGAVVAVLTGAPDGGSPA